MPRAHHHLAIDLGAGSGRAILGRFDDEAMRLEEVHRFANPTHRMTGRLRWDTQRLFAEACVGIRHAVARVGAGALASVGVDTWGVDFGLLDTDGALLEEPVCYRDPRTDGVMEAAFAHLDRASLYRLTGIQFLPFNTVFQLFAQRRLGEWPAGAAKLLMMPDILHHRLTGRTTGEYTQATTTQLINARSRAWEPTIFDALDLDASIMPELVAPGTRLGPLRAELARDLGLPAHGGPSLEVIAPATHDTASAVAGTPLEDGWLFLSSGTWSLLGMELTEPILTDAAYAHEFTNEGGVEGRIRFLKNVAGLWILESCRAEWAEAGFAPDHEALAAAVEAAPAFAGFIHPGDSRFLHPASMTEAVADYLHATGQPPVEDPATVARLVLESLAQRYAGIVAEIGEVTGREVRGVHVVGGGSRNTFLGQATADACGRPVRAGPAEATALGNLAVQAIASGRFTGLDDARAYLGRHVEIRTFEPRDTAAWREARARYAVLTAPDTTKESD